MPAGSRPFRNLPRVRGPPSSSPRRPSPEKDGSATHAANPQVAFTNQPRERTSAATSDRHAWPPLEIEMAGKTMAFPARAKLGVLRAAARNRKRAAGVEMTATGWCHRRGHITLEHDALAL